MKRSIIIILVILFFLSALFVFFPPDAFYAALINKSIIGGNVSKTHIVILGLVSFIVAGVINFIQAKYPKEYKDASRISFMPHNRYGWYGLIFFIAFFVLFYLYIFLS